MDTSVPVTSENPVPADPAKNLSELSSAQWKSGIAAWLGWLFDGLDMHLYGLVAAPFVAHLMGNLDKADELVKSRGSWIQAAFLVGWAVGGGFFGRIGDKLGRSRALSLTILVYALFSGLSFFAQTRWPMLIFRYVAALGIGGEWAVGSALLSETWPRKWGPWVAAVLQTGVNIGVMLACLTQYLIAGGGLIHLFGSDSFVGGMLAKYPERFVFLVGVIPAFLVLWIRKAVPEPEEWHAAKKAATGRVPSVMELFRGDVLRTTVLTIIVCACSLTPWWAFMFWNNQHMRNLPDVKGWTDSQREGLVALAFYLVITASTVGNFFSGLMAKLIGYRRAIALNFLGFFVAIMAAFWIPRDHAEMLWYIPFVGFFSGVFGLFTMYMPPLFPVLLRTTGAGFCYNIGRIAAAVGTVSSGSFAAAGDFRTPLFYVGFLFVPAMVVAMFLPDHEQDRPAARPLVVAD